VSLLALGGREGKEGNIVIFILSAAAPFCVMTCVMGEKKVLFVIHSCFVRPEYIYHDLQHLIFFPFCYLFCLKIFRSGGRIGKHTVLEMTLLKLCLVQLDMYPLTTPTAQRSSTPRKKPADANMGSKFILAGAGQVRLSSLEVTTLTAYFSVHEDPSLHYMCLS